MRWSLLIGSSQNRKPMQKVRTARGVIPASNKVLKSLNHSPNSLSLPPHSFVVVEKRSYIWPSG